MPQVLYVREFSPRQYFATNARAFFNYVESLSARPHVYRDHAEKHLYTRFRRFQRDLGMHTCPSVLAGSLSSGYSYMVEGEYGPMATKKFVNFNQFRQLYPEYRFIFVGDNGQGDVQAAEMMMEMHGNCMDACFIHQVQPVEATPGFSSKSAQKWQKNRIIFFDTYACSAFASHKLG